MADPIDDALDNPKRVKTQTGEFEERTADELIKLDQYKAAKASTKKRPPFRVCLPTMPAAVGPRHSPTGD